MNKRRFGMIVLITVLTMACQFFSASDAPVSGPISTSIATEAENVSAPETKEVEIDASNAVDEYFDLRAMSGGPKDYDDFCSYGSALLRQPSVAPDRDYETQKGEYSMKPNSWAEMSVAYYLGEADGGHFGNTSSYIKSYDTTLDRDLILSYYSSFFESAGYTPVESSPDSFVSENYFEWTGFDGYTLSLTILDLEARDPDDPGYKDLLYVDLSLEIVK